MMRTENRHLEHLRGDFPSIPLVKRNRGQPRIAPEKGWTLHRFHIGFGEADQLSAKALALMLFRGRHPSQLPGRLLLPSAFQQREADHAFAFQKGAVVDGACITVFGEDGRFQGHPRTQNPMPQRQNLFKQRATAFETHHSTSAHQRFVGATDHRVGQAIRVHLLQILNRLQYDIQMPFFRILIESLRVHTQFRLAVQGLITYA